MYGVKYAEGLLGGSSPGISVQGDLYRYRKREPLFKITLIKFTPWNQLVPKTQDKKCSEPDSERTERIYENVLKETCENSEKRS